MRSVFAFGLLLLSACAFADESDARCSTEDLPQGQAGGPGVVLLQVRGGASGASAAKSAAKVESSSDERLLEYTKLKTELAESNDAARIMKKIDLALDGGASGDKPSAANLDDIMESQDVLAAQDPKGMRAWTVEDTAAAGAKSPPRRGVSLVDMGAKARDSVEDDAEAEYSEGASADDGAEEEYAEDDDGVDVAEGDALEGDAMAEGDALEDDLEDEEDGEELSPSFSQLSTMRVQEADSVPLNEDGYIALATSRNNRKMERFVERLLGEMSLEVVDVGGLKGLVPYYSGQKATQSFDTLQHELRTTARKPDSWLTKKTGSWMTKNTMTKKSKTTRAKKTKRKKHTKTTNQNMPSKSLLNALSRGSGTAKKASASSPESALLQTGVAQADSDSPEKLSLLTLASATVTRAVHRVPDLAMAMFGSRMAILLCTVGIIACIFCMDERKRTGKNIDYENPLDISPTPPQAKPDPNMDATAIFMRGASNTPKKVSKA